MNEPLDRRNLAEPAIIFHALGLGLLYGSGWGALLGAAYAFLVGLVWEGAIFALVAGFVGIFFGGFYGLVLGGIHGLALGIVTTFYFAPLTNERTYRGAMAAVSLLLSAGMFLLLWPQYRDNGREWSVFLFLLGGPAPIAAITALIGSQRLADWYINKRIKLAQAYQANEA